jgi:hypothetical protein
MIIRLLGDGSSYQKMIGEAVSSTKEAAAHIQEAASKIEGFSDSIKGFAQTAITALAAFGAGSWLREATKAYGDQVRADRQLKLTLELNGRAVNDLFEDYSQFASQMQKTTTLADEQVIALLKQAETLGVTGEAAKRAVKNAIGLASAKGGEASGFIRVTAALESGRVMARAINPALMAIKDPTERAAKAQEMLGKMFMFAERDAQSLGGQIKQLSNLYGDLMEDFGEIITQFTKPIRVVLLEIGKDLVAWFKELSPAIKLSIVLTVAFIAAFAGLTVAIAVAGKVFNVFFGGIGIIAGIVITALVAIAGATTGLIVGLGSVTSIMSKIKDVAMMVWTFIKTKLSEFAAWAFPIWQAFRDAAIAAWEMIKEAARVAWDFIVGAAQTAWNFVLGVWDSITGGARISFAEIGDNIRDAFIMAEFTIRNWAKVAEWVWAGTKLGFIVAADSIIFFFEEQLPRFLSWFGRNWTTIFSDAFFNAGVLVKNYTNNTIAAFTAMFSWIADSATQLGKAFMVVFSNLGANLVAVFKNMKGLIKGTVKMEDIWAPLAEGLELQFRKLPTDAEAGIRPLAEGLRNNVEEILVMPERAMGPLEERLRKEFEQLGGALALDFEQFKAKKLAQFAKEGEAQAKASGTKVGEGMNAGLAAEMKKTEGILRFSAESVSRIGDYMEKLSKINAPAGGANAGAAAGAGAVGGVNLPPVPNLLNNALPAAVDNPLVTGQQKTNALLKNILDVQIALANKQGINIQPAGLAA